jgi:hypothetical protein
VSVNPYRDLPIYGPEYIKSYKGREMFERPAHIFALAEAAYRTLKQRSVNSCIVISGRYTITKNSLIFFSIQQANQVQEKQRHQKSFFVI